MKVLVSAGTGLLLLGVVSGGAIAPAPVVQAAPLQLAQSYTPEQIRNYMRAKNYARQAAEAANGGLNRYHAEKAMHGPLSEAPFVDNGDGTVTFTFCGGPPGFTTPTTESVVTVRLDGWKTTVDYNGAIRDDACYERHPEAVVPTAEPDTTVVTRDEDTVITSQSRTVVYRNTLSNLNRAKNYARQAAEEANGGLGRYRAEKAMHGPVREAPMVENEDGTVTFTFCGGPPGYATPTTESVVTVTINGWATEVDYNGDIRDQKCFDRHSRR